MRSPDVTSVEQLEALLADGRISEEDYDTLRAAMERKEEAAAAPGHSSVSSTLRRSSRNRVIAGVCGGIAESMGYEPSLVRLLAVLLLLFSGGSAVIAYLVLVLALPASETDGAPRPEAGFGGFPWAFAAAVLVLWTAHFVYSACILPRFMEFWAEAGAELPGLTKLVVMLDRSILGSSFIGLSLQAGISVLFVVLYTILPRKGAARVVMWVVLLFAAAVWAGVALVSLYLPLFRVGDIIR